MLPPVTSSVIPTGPLIATNYYKLECHGVVIKNGHVIALGLAVLDVPKNEEEGNDRYGSKIICVAFRWRGHGPRSVRPFLPIDNPVTRDIPEHKGAHHESRQEPNAIGFA
jgi:hypothetical protein